MSTIERIIESRTDAIHVFIDFSKPSNKDEASTETRSINKYQIGKTAFPSVINTVN